MMEVKGSIITSTKNFVDDSFPGKFDNWLNSLPEESKKYFTGPVYATNWYPLNESVVVPTLKVGELFYKGDGLKGAWDAGRYSAEIALKGIYKVFVRVSTPLFLMKRAQKILASFYQPSDLKIVNTTSHSFHVHLTDFSEPSKIVEHRIGGWIAKALEMTKCKNVSVVITKSTTDGANVTEYEIKWD